MPRGVTTSPEQHRVQQGKGEALGFLQCKVCFGGHGPMGRMGPRIDRMSADYTLLK